MKLGQQYGNAAVLFVFSVSNLHFSFAIGNGPQSSTNSNNLKKIGWIITNPGKSFKVSYFGGVSSETTHVDLPQNGANSHVLPGSTVAHLVEAKHMPGKSVNNKIIV